MSQHEFKTRRAALGALACVPALAIPAAAMAASDDSEILVIAAEIQCRQDLADDIRATRVAPFDDEYHALMKVDATAGWAFSDATGREAAVEEIEDMLLRNTHLFERMVALPTSTQAGTRARSAHGCATMRRLVDAFRAQKAELLSELPDASPSRAVAIREELAARDRLIERFEPFTMTLH
jgi:hypothetical protein